MIDAYTGDATYDTVLAAAFAFVGLVVIGAAFVDSPYGRFADDKWGASVGPRLGWFLMELPATVVFVAVFVSGRNRAELVPLIFLGMWLIHYGNRGFVFPFLIRAPRGAKGTFSLMVMSMGWLVTALHAYLNAKYVSDLGTHYDAAWLTDPRFICGVVIYYAGFFANLHSDAVIRKLRTHEEVASGEKVYRIPQGGLFRWVTCPSYLSELVGWCGFALATWCLGSVFVLAISIANLVPRAKRTHAWYRERFEDYPEERRALIPFIW